MLEEVFKGVYDKFKLNFYRSIYSDFAERESSLTATETFCLEVIYALERPTIKELANFLNISQPNMTYKVNVLIKKGYAMKNQSQEDKREVIVETTEKFAKYLEIKNEYIHLVLDRTKERFDEETLREFEKALQIISEELMPEISQGMNRFRS